VYSISVHWPDGELQLTNEGPLVTVIVNAPVLHEVGGGGGAGVGVLEQLGPGGGGGGGG
jgi:hypothetical protein